MEKGKLKPTLKDVVLLLMKKEEVVYKDVDGRNETRSNVLHCVYECSRKHNCRSGGRIVFEKNRGFSNAYAHLKSCIVSGNEADLLQTYFSALQNSSMSGQSSIKDHFCINLSSSPREQAMYSYIKAITMLSLPVSYMENASFREFSKHTEVLSVKSLKEPSSPFMK